MASPANLAPLTRPPRPPHNKQQHAVLSLARRLQAVAVTVVDGDDGGYAVVWEPTRSGPHLLDVRLLGRPVAGRCL